IPVATARVGRTAELPRPVVFQGEEWSMRDLDRWAHEGRGSRARRARTTGLLLCVLLGLWNAGSLLAGLHAAWARTTHRDGVPFPPLQWKALLLAGDDSIGAFDHAIAELAALFEQHHITVVQQFSASPTRLSATVRPSTLAELRASIPVLQVQLGEGCL